MGWIHKKSRITRSVMMDLLFGGSSKCLQLTLPICKSLSMLSQTSPQNCVDTNFVKNRQKTNIFTYFFHLTFYKNLQTSLWEYKINRSSVKIIQNVSIKKFFSMTLFYQSTPIPVIWLDKVPDMWKCLMDKKKQHLLKSFRNY